MLPIIDSRIIRTIFKIMFPDYKLIYPEFKVIGDVSMIMLNKLYEKESRNIYEDEVIYFAMKIA